jgi:hypothetical protein
MNRQQQEVIEYLKKDNRILLKKLGPGRIQSNVPQKRRLATAAFRVGRKLLRDCATFFSPDTLLKWHRMLVARKLPPTHALEDRLNRLSSRIVYAPFCPGARGGVEML